MFTEERNEQTGVHTLPPPPLKNLQGPVLDNPSDLTLATVILIVFGIFMLLFGLLMFLIQAGLLPFNPDSTFGLLLVLLSIQMITLGKTPFGTFRRTWIVIILGFSTAIIGTGACFIPGFLAGIIPQLVGCIMISGGVMLFFNLLFSEGRARQWIRIPGVLQHLTVACGFVYLTVILFGFVVLFPRFLPDIFTGLLMLVMSAGLFYLAWCIQTLSLQYPPKERDPETSEDKDTSGIVWFLLHHEASLSVPVSFILLLGIIFIECAIILIPSGKGYYLFSRDGQFGLLMVIMAVQVLALGKTPFGVYKRSWFLICIGILIALLGMYSCIVPGLLGGRMLLILGFWNLLTGSTGLTKIVIPVLQSHRSSPNTQVSLSKSKKKLLWIVIILHLLTIGFGMNLILPGIIPSIVVLANLFILGFLMIHLASMLRTIPLPL